MEMFNGGCIAIGYDDYSPRVYDDILRTGKKIFAVAGDDNHNRLISNPSFYGTRKLTRDDLPVGSVIVLADGWIYRPDGWIGNAKTDDAVRPAESTTAMVIVTEEWWGDFNYRAFNISTTAQGVISDNYLEFRPTGAGHIVDGDGGIAINFVAFVGSDINASCGQLRRKYNKENK